MKYPELSLENISLNRLLESVDDELIMLRNINNVPFFDAPIRSEGAIAILCLKGFVEGAVDFKPVKLEANDFMILLPGQSIQYLDKSEDFDAVTILASKKFIDSSEFSTKESVSVFFFLRENPKMHLRPEEVRFLLDCNNIIKQITLMYENSQRMMMIKLMAQAFFYGIFGFLEYQQRSEQPKTKGEIQFDTFIKLLSVHYKESREVSFYAEKMHLTPKHLSRVIKELSGRSALEWINAHVLLEAKVLLKTSNRSIQMVSEELNFPSQSFFGKFFKRMTGMCPKAYCNK